MKTLILSLTLLMSVSAFSADPITEEPKCAASGSGIDPTYVIQQVKMASSCYDASQIVEMCAAGSSMDTQTTAAAIEVCDKLVGKLTPSDASLKKTMNERCAKVCNPRTDGTLCLSMISFCTLDVSKFISRVNNK